MRCLCLLPTALMVLLIVGVLTGLFVHLPLSRVLAMLVSAETSFALRLTLLTSGAATLIAVLMGVPAGHFLARQTFRGKIVVDTLIDLPMTMTPLVAGVGLLFLLSGDAVRQTLDGLGIELLFTPWGAILAQVLIVTPVMTRTARAAFAAIDTRYEQAAETLGLTPGQVFLRISLPMARPVLLSGMVLCWARAVGEFGATLMVAGAHPFPDRDPADRGFPEHLQRRIGPCPGLRLVVDPDRLFRAAGHAPDRCAAFG